MHQTTRWNSEQFHQKPNESDFVERSMNNNLTAQELKVMGYLRTMLSKGTNPSASQLARQFGFSPQYGRRVLHRLQLKGQITRDQDGLGRAIVGSIKIILPE